MTKFFKLKLLMIPLFLVVSFFSKAQSIKYGYSFDLSNSPTTEALFSVATNETDPTAIAFSTNGLKMYIVGFAGNVHQYSLTAAHNISSGVSYDGSPFDASGEVPNPHGIAFNTTGTKMFLTGTGGTPSVWQYSLSIPFDITSGVSHDGFPLTVSSQEGSPRGITFNPEGSKMYVIGNNGDEVNQYSLTSNFIITSGVSHDGFYSVSSQDINPQEVAFSNDGLKMFVTGLEGIDVNQYTLSTPFDITGIITFDGSPFSVAGEETGPLGITFNSNGSKMFIAGFGGDEVNQYDLNVGGFTESTEKDGSIDGSLNIYISGETFTNAGGSLTFGSNYSISSIPSGLNPSLSVEADGLSAVLTFTGSAADHQAINSLSSLEFTFFNTAFTGGDASVVSNSTAADSEIGIDFDDNPALTYGNFYDVANATFTGTPFSVVGEESSPTDVAFSQDGTKMFVTGFGSNGIKQYTLSAPFNINGEVSFDGTYIDLSGQEDFPQGLTFNNDGTKLYTVGALDDNIDQYNLTIPFDISSGVTHEGSHFVRNEEGTSRAIQFNNDGTKVYIIGSTEAELIQYSLATPFDVTSGVSLDGSTSSLSSLETQPAGFSFNEDGSKLFTLGPVLDNINEYQLNTPFDITGGIIYQGVVKGINGQELNPVGLTFSEAGDRMYVIGTTGVDINQYDIAGNGFSEVVANDGSVSGSMFLQVEDDTFTNTGSALTEVSDYSITNLPSGLTPTLTVSADGLTATLTLGGSADDHEDINDISSLEFTFENSAFTSNNASIVVNATNAESGFGIDFNDKPEITYGFSGDELNDLNNTAFYEGTPYSVGGEESKPTGLVFNNDGTKMYIVGEGGDEVNQYSLTYPFDVTAGVTFDLNPLDISGQDIIPKDIAFNTDGTKMFMVGSATDAVYQYSLSNPFDITSGVTYDNVSLSITSQDESPEGIAFSPDGTKMFIIGTDGKSSPPNFDEINQYTLANPFDLTTDVTFDGSPYEVVEDHFPSDLHFNADGTKMFIIGTGNRIVTKYTLTNPYDVTSGVSIDGNSYSVIVNNPFPVSIAFNTEGDRMFILSGSTGGKRVGQYLIGAGGFEEKAKDDGSVRGALTIRLSGETFTSANSNLTPTTDYEITNLPAGLTPTIAIAADGLSAVLTLSGSASSHDEINDLASLELNFENSAFTTVAAENILNATSAASGFGIDFIQEITWDGTVWSNGTGPLADDDAIINGNYSVDTDGVFDVRDLTINNGFTLTVDGENAQSVQRDLINNGTLIVESGSSLLVNSPNTITGNDITFKRNTRYSDGRYSFVGSPVEQDASIVGSDLGTSVYKYNEATAYGADGINRWEDASADELVPGKGYTQAFQQEIVFTGMPNQGTITIDGTFNEVGNDDHEGWVLVSNPYPAPIDVADFLGATENDNIEGTIYIWDDNGSNSQRGTNADYIAANGTMVTNSIPTPAGGASRYDQIMGSMQGFFVKLIDDTDTEVTFKEDMRVTGNSDDHFFRETTLPIARINLTNNDGLFRQAVIGFAEDATNSVLNRTYDGQAFNSTSDNGLFTMKAGRTLSLNGMTCNWEVVQIQLNIAEAGIYQISVELEDYDHSIYLRDNVTGDITDLRSGVYTFNSQAGIDTDRFELISSPSNVLALEDKKVLVYAYNSVLHIQQEGSEAREYQLFNMKGQMMLSKRVESHEEEIDLNALSKGIYLVFDGQKTHKIILK